MSTSPVPRRLEYALVDVFAERPLEGNMLAIFTDARGLTDAEMQALARETNLAETAFILPAQDPERERTHGVRVRIFTTQEELPFAGHPTLGTASWLYLNHPVLHGAESIVLGLKSGPVKVRFRAPGEHEQGVFGMMKQRDPVFGRQHDAGLISRVTGIPTEEIDPSSPIQTVTTGLPFCIVRLRNLAALDRLEIPQAAAKAYLAASDAKFFYVFAPTEAASGAAFQGRMQFYGGEDPATGSASGCAIAYMVRYGLIASGHEIVLEQGIQIGRPSRIVVSAALTDGAVARVFVGGRTIPVASGHFSLP